jgi:hypothetical protein
MGRTTLSQSSKGQTCSWEDSTQLTNPGSGCPKGGNMPHFLPPVIKCWRTWVGVRLVGLRLLVKWRFGWGGGLWHTLLPGLGAVVWETALHSMSGCGRTHAHTPHQVSGWLWEETGYTLLIQWSGWEDCTYPNTWLWEETTHTHSDQIGISCGRNYYHTHQSSRN